MDGGEVLARKHRILCGQAMAKRVERCALLTGFRARAGGMFRVRAIDLSAGDCIGGGGRHSGYLRIRDNTWLNGRGRGSAQVIDRKMEIVERGE